MGQNFDYFKYYEDYLWLHVDFETLQNSALRAEMKARMRDRFGRKILHGLDFASAVNFDVTINKGTAINPDGDVLSFTADEEVTFAGPSGGQGRWSLVVIRKVTTLINLISEPLNPTNDVPLNERQSSEIVVLDGVLGASAYPATLSGDVILFGVKIQNGDTAVTTSRLDYTVSNLFKTKDVFTGQKPLADAVVGPENLKETTHASFNDLMLDANIASIKKILVNGNISLDTIQTIDQDDLEIVVSPGSVISKGTAATGLNITGNRVTIYNGKFSGFNGGSDVAVAFQGETGLLFGTRFFDCSIEVDDQSVNGTVVQATQTEV